MTKNGNPAALSYDEELLHIKETITMLCLAVCQIEASLNDSNKSVDSLTASFSDLATHSRSVDQSIQSMNDQSDLPLIKEKVKETSNEIQTKINQAITAFQFYDRISQRLDHVARSLESVSDTIGDQEKINDINIWQAIQASVKSSYTMESERIMFEHIVRGSTIREALEVYRHHFSEEDISEEDGDEIELF